MAGTHMAKHNEDLEAILRHNVHPKLPEHCHVDGCVVWGTALAGTHYSASFLVHARHILYELPHYIPNTHGAVAPDLARLRVR